MSFILNPLYGTLQKVQTLQQTLSAGATATTQAVWTAGGIKFDDNIAMTFGTGDDATILYNGTDMVVDPGPSLLLKLGASGDRNIQLNKIGLGTTAVSALNWIAFNQTVSTGRGALSFTLTYTGAGTLLANVASALTHQGTAASGTIIGYNSSMTKDQDQSGTASFYSLKATIATASARSITQGTSNMYGLHIDNAGVGTGHTGGTVRQYGLFINALGTYSGVATYEKWGILSSEDIQINDNKYLIFGGDATTKATNRMRWNTTTSTIDTEVNATIEKTLATSLETYKDGLNVAVGSTTGTKIATAITQKLGFYGVTPITQRAGAAQAAVATTAATNIAPFGYTTQAQADAIVTLVNELRAWAVAQGFIKGAA